ncbi:MAG: hypothetical protein JWQ97_185 [Phenylobacterium sp.]|nr:hypothetical protein [Phenylobacterium sp.]
MAQAKMIVLAAATDGQVAALDEWYETRHVPDLLQVPGVKSIQRFDARMLKVPEGAPGWDFIGIYDLEADDIDAVLREAGVRMGTPQMPASPALDSSKTLALVAYPKSKKP